MLLILFVGVNSANAVSVFAQQEQRQIQEQKQKIAQQEEELRKQREKQEQLIKEQEDLNGSRIQELESNLSVVFVMTILDEL